MRKAVRVALIVMLALGILLGGTVLYVVNHINHKFEATHDDGIVVDPLPPGRAYNILVLGSDRRDIVDRSQRDDREFRGSGGRLADTMFVIHVPADQKSATILSFPRDLRVRIPGKSGHSKINAAYAGGPNLVIKTIKAHTGLSIHHYVEVNFASFQKIVDAVGGVRLCVDRAYNDRPSGLVIRKPGCSTFAGKLALAYVRMRKQDPRGDFGRIERQQQFLRVLMSKVTSIGFLTDLPRLFKLADAVSKGIVTDQNLGLGEVRGIANKLAGFRQSSVDFRVVPSFPKYIGNVAYVVERESQARAVYKALREDTPLPDYGKTGASIPQPEDVTVSVLNGTPTRGLAAVVRDDLEKKGFDVTHAGNAPRRDYTKTTISFRFGAEAKARLIQDEFPDAVVRDAPPGQDADIVLILGSDVASRASPSPVPS